MVLRSFQHWRVALPGALHAYGRCVNVTAYGSLGNGVADAPAISAAIAAVGAGGIVYLDDRGTKVKAASTRTFVFTGTNCTLEGLTVERDVAQTQPISALTSPLELPDSLAATWITSTQI